jgi:hypothetical protein
MQYTYRNQEEKMKLYLGIIFLCVAFLSLAHADTIYLKNGLKIIGQVPVKTMTGELKFPVIDIEKIETGEPIIPLAPAVPEKTGNVSTSLKQVGYGCLGGVVGGSLAGLISIWGNGFGDGRVAGTLILGAVIAGIIIGAQLGGTK